MAYYGTRPRGCTCRSTSTCITTPWQARRDRALVERLRGGAARRARWPNWVLGNHDRSRIASRVGAGAGARRRDAAADAARHADALLRRRARHARRADRRPSACRIRGSGTCPGRASGAIPSARRCSGTSAERRLLRARGDPWLPLADDAARITSRASATTRTRCCRCTARCWRCAGPSRRCPSAPTARSRSTTTCSPICAATSSVAINLPASPSRPAARGVVLLGTDPAREGETLRRALRLAGGEAVIVRTSRGA